MRSVQTFLLWLPLAAALHADTIPVRATAPQVANQTLKQVESAAARGEADSARELGDRYFHGRDGLSKDEIKAVYWYRKAADQGHIMAIADLGYCTLNGLGGLAKDEGSAISLFRTAADGGNAYAARMLGWMHERGCGTPRDDGKAAEWYRRAASQGDEEALVDLAWLTEEGRGVPRDDFAAGKMYAIGVSKGNAIAMNNLGWFYASGRGGLAKDYDLARQLFEVAAVKGNPRADGNLGYLFENGLGVPRDLMASMSHFRDGANGGDLLSQLHLGYVYESGELVPKDLTQALHFFRLAAAQGDRESFQGIARVLMSRPSPEAEDAAALVPLCQNSLKEGLTEARVPLALALLLGIGAPPQPEEAKRRLLEATRDQPPSPLLIAIAKLSQFGHGLPLDPALGRSLLESMSEQGIPIATLELAKAMLEEPGQLHSKGLRAIQELSQAGDAKACFELGLLYQNGRGVPVNPAKAVALFTTAAKAGLAEAMFHLGLIHQSGICVKKNPTKAKEWYLRAEAAGFPIARGRVLPNGKLAPLSTLTGPVPTR